jgi:hypothetical protein
LDNSRVDNSPTPHISTTNINEMKGGDTQAFKSIKHQANLINPQHALPGLQTRVQNRKLKYVKSL